MYYHTSMAHSQEALTHLIIMEKKNLQWPCLVGVRTQSASQLVAYGELVRVSVPADNHQVVVM